MTTEAAVALVFLPLLGALALMVVPSRARAPVVVATLGSLPILMLPVTMAVGRGEPLAHTLGGWAVPLGITLMVDSVSLLMLWLTAVVGALAGIHALAVYPPGAAQGARFWPMWLLMIAAMNGLFMSADLFNIYVALEMMTLSATSLIAMNGGPAALRAAMRYLLLAMLASLIYLLGIALLYSSYGVLDLYLIGRTLERDITATTAFALITAGLLLKTAIFPLHVWLPGAHANAPGPVSAVLSGVVVKVTLYLLLRLWLWTGASLELSQAKQALGLLGLGAIVYGSVAALVQERLKMIVAYSTVAQLGYMMLAFPLAGPRAWNGVVYLVLTHGLAKAGMFLAAANVLACTGSDRLKDLGGLDRLMPVNLFAFALGGVSIMGLPPSGGFLAKWMLLEAAWDQRGWIWVGALLGGSLLAAAYVFRVLAVAFFRPPGDNTAGERAPVHRAMTLSALISAVLAVLLGFVSAPILEIAEMGAPELGPQMP